MTTPLDRYPRTVTSGDTTFALRLMQATDEPQVLAFARSLPQHDLLFVRRDITKPKVLSAWVREIAAENIVSLLAHRNDKLVGCAAVVRDVLSFSPHVGDLRVLVSPDVRELGLGRTLVQESFLISLAMGLEKLTAHMTARVGNHRDLLRRRACEEILVRSNCRIAAPGSVEREGLVVFRERE
jgi:N-acetylglutamate synthase-like GNAT family acetyltransferase